jgi:HEAT repeat protein
VFDTLVRAVSDRRVLPDVRIAGLQLMAHAHHPDTRRAALATFADPAPALAAQAVRVWTTVQDPADLARVAALAASPAELLREEVARALRGVGRPEARRAIEKLLADPVGPVRTEAAHSYAVDPLAEEPKVNALLRGDVAVRNGAATGLALRRDAFALRLLGPALLVDDPPREALVEFFRTRPGLELVPFFRDLLGAKDAGVRADAMDRLGMLGDKASSPAIARGLRSAVIDERMAAARTLARLGAENEAQGVAALLADPNDAVRATAANALVDLHATSALPALERAAKAETGYLKSTLEEDVAKLRALDSTRTEQTRKRKQGDTEH